MKKKDVNSVSVKDKTIVLTPTTKKLFVAFTDCLYSCTNTNLYKINVRKAKKIELLKHPLCKEPKMFFELFHNGTKTIDDTQQRAVSRCVAFHKKQLKQDSINFNVFLNCFKSCGDFINFIELMKDYIKQQDLTLDEKQAFYSFYKELKIFRDALFRNVGVSHTKYLLWMNQTIYSKRHLIYAIYYKWFGNELTPTRRDIKYRANSKKSKFEVSHHCSTDENGYTSVIPDVLDGYNQPKRVVEMSKAYAMLLDVAEFFGHKKDLQRYEVWRTGLAQSYGFKFVHHLLSSHSMKVNEQNKRLRKSVKVAKIQEATGFNHFAIRDFVRGQLGIDILETDGSHRKLRKLLKSEYFKDLEIAINSKLDAVVVKIGKNLKPVAVSTMVEQLVERMNK